MAAIAKIYEGRLQRRLNPGNPGQIHVAFDLGFSGGKEVCLDQVISV